MKAGVSWLTLGTKGQYASSGPPYPSLGFLKASTSFSRGPCPLVQALGRRHGDCNKVFGPLFELPDTGPNFGPLPPSEFHNS